MTKRVNIKAENTIAFLNPVLFPNIEITMQKMIRLLGISCVGKRRGKEEKEGMKHPNT